MKTNVAWIILIFVSCTLSGMAQDQSKTQEYQQQAEQYKRAALMRVLDSGVVFMDAGNYTAADIKFQQVLKNTKSVPSDLTFYFGKNSYHLQNYKQSIDWLNKYLQLKGTSGQFSAEATQLLKKSENEFLKEKSKEVTKAKEVLSNDFEIDCGPEGKVVCPVCKGDHVITKKGAFGIIYQTCGYCDEHGLLSCVEYNQLLRGELKSKL